MPKDTRLLVEAAIVLAIGGLLIWGVSAMAINSAISTAGKSDRSVATSPVTYKESSNIKVATPKDGDTLSSPFLLSGQARVFEATVNFRLKDANGKVVVEGTAKTKEGQVFSPFSYEVSFTKPLTATGTVEVFQKSAKDGSDQDLVSISVKF